MQQLLVRSFKMNYTALQCFFDLQSSLIYRRSRCVDTCDPRSSGRTVMIEGHLNASKLRVYWLHVLAGQSTGWFSV